MWQRLLVPVRKKSIVRYDLLDRLQITFFLISHLALLLHFVTFESFRIVSLNVAQVETLTIDATNANRAAKAAEAAVAEFKAGNVPDNTSAATTAASGSADASVATGGLLPGLNSDSTAGGGNGDLLGYVAPSAASVMIEGGEVNQNDGSSGAAAAAADANSAAGAATNTAAPATAAATTPTLESLEAALDSANEEAASASLARGDALARQKEAHAEAAAALEQVGRDCLFSFSYLDTSFVRFLSSEGCAILHILTYFTS